MEVPGDPSAPNNGAPKTCVPLMDTPGPKCLSDWWLLSPTRKLVSQPQFKLPPTSSPRRGNPRVGCLEGAQGLGALPIGIKQGVLPMQGSGQS